MYEIGIVYTLSELDRIRESNKVVKAVHTALTACCTEGTTTQELDELALEVIIKKNAKPAFKGYRGYPFSICTSVNDTIVHGFPDKTKLKNGDIISIDVGAIVAGLYGDACITVEVGNVSAKAKKLVEFTDKALNNAAALVKDGTKIGTLGYEISRTAKEGGFGVVTGYIGHGIGYVLHDTPSVRNVGELNKGFTLKEGMVICIEPLLTEGSPDSYKVPGKWDVKTKDKGLAAHAEHCILVLKDGCEILNS